MSVCECERSACSRSVCLVSSCPSLQRRASRTLTNGDRRRRRRKRRTSWTGRSARRHWLHSDTPNGSRWAQLGCDRFPYTVFIFWQPEHSAVCLKLHLLGFNVWQQLGFEGNVMAPRFSFYHHNKWHKVMKSIISTQVLRHWHYEAFTAQLMHSYQHCCSNKDTTCSLRSEFLVLSTCISWGSFPPNTGTSPDFF